MSSEAITRRLRRVDELRTLCLSLMKAKKKSDAEKAKTERKDAENKRDADEI